MNMLINHFIIASRAYSQQRIPPPRCLMFSDFITFRFVINTKIASSRLIWFDVFNFDIISQIASGRLICVNALKFDVNNGGSSRVLTNMAASSSTTTSSFRLDVFRFMCRRDVADVLPD